MLATVSTKFTGWIRRHCIWLTSKIEVKAWAFSSLPQICWMRVSQTLPFSFFVYKTSAHIINLTVYDTLQCEFSHGLCLQTKWHVKVYLATPQKCGNDYIKSGKEKGKKIYCVCSSKFSRWESLKVEVLRSSAVSHILWKICWLYLDWKTITNSLGFRIRGKHVHISLLLSVLFLSSFKSSISFPLGPRAVMCCLPLIVHCQKGNKAWLGNAVWVASSWAVWFSILLHTAL